MIPGKGGRFFILLIAVLVCCSLWAGTTGKITGRVIDSQNQEPLVGVNVMLEGTYLGAATDMEGRYLILNIPPGVYNLRMSMMGYRETVTQQVRVRIDLTTNIDASLETTVLETDESVTIIAERAMVQRDMTGSLSAVGGDEIETMPVQSINDVLELQAGVVQSGGLHIRGGRSGEVAYWVDGVATTDVFSGGMGLTVENSAVSELQVISGTFNAEYGQAMSGIVNIITKEGGQTYSGEIKAWVGDYFSQASQFGVMESVAESVDPISGRPVGAGVSENPLAKFNPNYNVEFNLGGPVPLFGDKLSFFANGRYVTDEGYLYGRQWFLPIGAPGDSSLVPMNPYERISGQFKLTYRMTPNIKISYNGFWNDWQNDRSFSHDYKYNPMGIPKQFGKSMSHIFSLNHVLSPTTFYELKVNRFFRDYTSHVYDNPLTMPDYLVHVMEDTARGVEAFTFDPNTEEGKERLKFVQDQEYSFQYFTDPNGPLGYVHPDSARQPIGYSYLKAGQNLSQYFRSTAYWVGKFDLTSQVQRAHQIKAGFELRLYELELDSYTLQRALKEGKSEEIIPFTPWVPPVSNRYHDYYKRKPRELSAYLQDKIELKDLIMNIGVRFDYFDANSIILADPRDPNIYDPMLDENTYKNPDAAESERIEYTSEERRAFMHKKVETKMQLSPRLGIAYPISDQGVIHFSYGHFFQIPEFQYLYDSPDFKFSKGGALEIVGNADLKPQRTVMYEIGLQQQITQNIGLDVTLFYRDVRDWVGTGTAVVTYLPAISYSLFENKDYSNVRGVTFKMEKRYANHFSARLDYSYQVVEGTYSNPADAFNAMQALQEPRLAIIPLNWDQNHTLNASVTTEVMNWAVSLIGRYWTGRPYTPGYARGSTVGTSTFSGLRENSARLPNQKSVDLYLHHMFNLDLFKVKLFINVYNIFDIQDENAVYGDSGTAEYTTLINREFVDYDPRRISTLEDYVNQPGWYTSPRQLQIGASILF